MTLASGPDPWTDRARCREEWAELWFPDSGGSRSEVHAAVAVCGRCEVRAECLDAALGRNEQYGIWGGLTVSQRDTMRRERREEAS